MIEAKMKITNLYTSEVYEIDGTIEALEEWVEERNEFRLEKLDENTVEDLLNQRHYIYDLEWSVK